MTRKRNKPQGTTLECIDKDYEKVILQRHKDFQDGYNKAVEKAYKYLSSLLFDGHDYEKYFCSYDGVDDFIKDFQKVMKE